MLAAFTSGNAVLLWIVTFVAAEVRPSFLPNQVVGRQGQSWPP
jgi:hypothetical protein